VLAVGSVAVLTMSGDVAVAVTVTVRVVYLLFVVDGGVMDRSMDVAVNGLVRDRVLRVVVNAVDRLMNSLLVGDTKGE